MVTLLIIGVVVLSVIGVLVVSRTAKRDVQLVDFATSKGAPADSVEALIRAGQKLEAIKRYRETTGVGLKEAKDAVEAMERGETPPVANASPPSATVEELVQSGRMIEAIKRHRALTGLGLNEAKDAVEAMARGVQPGPPAMPRRITSEMAIDDAELRGHMSAGRVTDAIKRYRELTGLGLKEAKDAVEALRQTYKS
jgi:ribosomal protein L7/L12